MSALKRNISTRSTRLSAKASPYNASVTLFKLEDVAQTSLDPEPSPRRAKRAKLDVDERIFDLEDVVLDTSGSSTLKKSRSSSSPKKQGASPRKVKPIPQALDNPHPAPENWKEVYDAIKEMRSKIVAPVDTMGCDQAQLKEIEPKVSPCFCGYRSRC